MPVTSRQREAFEEAYGKTGIENWDFERKSDPVVRFIRERRVRKAIARLMAATNSTPAKWNVLALCAGPGEEGTLLADLGFNTVTVSDFSEYALELSKSLDPRLLTQLLDAEDIRLPDNSYDLVIVQDGLHHLPRPALGLTEMIRVAKRAVIVIEPHEGLVSRALGTVWEITGSELNYVFRWNKWLFAQIIRSYLLLGENTKAVMQRSGIDPKLPYRLDLRDDKAASYKIDVLRLWDHHVTMRRLSKAVGGGKLGFAAVKMAYRACSLILPGLGNIFIGILVKTMPVRD